MNTSNPTAAPTCEFLYCLSQAEIDQGLKISQFVQIIAILALVSFTLAVGAALDIDKFKHAWRKPIHPLIGLLCQTLVNPALMFILLTIFDYGLKVEAKVMAILISVAPGGASSNLLTYLAYGELEISVAMTIVSTIAAFGTVPLFLFIGVQLFLEDEDIEIAFANILIACLGASLPPLVGVILQKYAYDSLIKLIKIFGIAIGIIFLFVIVIISIVDPVFRAGYRNAGNEIFIIAFLFNIGALSIGYSVPFILRFPESERRAIAFEVGAQNSSLPLAIVYVSFGLGINTVDFLPFLGVYLGLSFIVNYSLVAVMRYCLPKPELLDAEGNEGVTNENVDSEKLVA